MTMTETATQLRQKLADCRKSKGFNRYDAALKQEAARYARARRSQGPGVTVIAKELGVAVATVEAWLRLGQSESLIPRGQRHERSDAGSLSLVPVVVRPEAQRVVSRLEVDFGDGTRLQATGIAADDLARAIETLRRRA